MSALARSWRHIWTLLPCLCLGGLLDLLGYPDDPNDIPVSSNWIKRVHHLLSSLQSPLLVCKFSHCFHSDQSALLQSILDLLLQRSDLETLGLYSYWDQVVLHLPSFHSVQVLELCECHIILPTGFCGFNCLITLFLTNVQISNHHLHLLIHTSNHLTTFKSDWVVSDDPQDPLSVNISLPLLRHLEFGIINLLRKYPLFLPQVWSTHELLLAIPQIIIQKSWLW